MNRRRKPLYILARLGLNAFASFVFYLAVSAVGVHFSWSLYWCAFAVYVVLSFGDQLIDELWPLITDGSQS